MKKIVVRVGLGAGAAVLGLMLGAGVAGADDSVRITGDETGSVRITGVDNREFGVAPANRDF
ncbi:hypothetical protein [Amycolatopsis orientalis]|uniref:Uncharacterized protein n=1 Tax=Amycolatopsis orientalis TaxID=31958 RepID=A0A193BWZ7_AMYOR|nr:hypothetical protein [Amycolatopsis orientalis]ANN16688.1 hypothetical protein SD37_14160 [Amycolatopsis orientalis]